MKSSPLSDSMGQGSRRGNELSTPSVAASGEAVHPAPGPIAAPGTAGKWIGWLLFLSIIGGAVLTRERWWPLMRGAAPAATAAPGRGGAGRPTPVVVAMAQTANVDLYLDGLGTIAAFNTVTVRSRVAGEIVKVAFSEGQEVKEGALLVEIDPRPIQAQLAQAEGQLARDKAALNLAEVNLRRQMELLKSQATTQQIIDQQVAMVDQAKAVVQVTQGIVDNARLQLEYTKITAPLSGWIGLRLVDKGNIVQGNDATGLLVITQLEPISLVFTIPQDEIPRVQRQMREKGVLVVEAYDRDFQTKLATGTLEAIDNQVDSTTGTLRLKAKFENKDHILFPNQFVNARLLVETLQDAIVIPAAAVQRGDNGTFVYVARSDGTAEMRPLELGPVTGGKATIRSGLQPGEAVVVEGIDKLIPGGKITIPDPSAGKKSGKPGTAPTSDTVPKKPAA
jgi:multidrug efflux system membrane fusion protein